jgi:RNA polymerase sigma-70 factor (ECF subfamily)
MDQEGQATPLSRISTLWSVVCRAHDGEPQAVNAAQQELIGRYSRAIHRYLLGAVRDPEAAEELSQEFALRFIRGDLRGADPERGRFRDFVKGVLFHLIADHHRRRARSPSLPAGLPEPADDPAQLERQFVNSWREEMLNRTWEALARVEQRTGRAFHTVLRLKADHPQLRSAQMAERLARQLGKPVTAASVRQTLHRAREKFVDLLVEEVLHTLREPNVDKLEQELIDLGLHGYCKEALQRYRGKP